MCTIKEKLTKAEGFYNNMELDAAFRTLNEVISSSHSTNSEIAEAWNWKGIIVGGPAPYLSEFEEDYSGLAYFLKALEHKNSDVNILLNILNSFSPVDELQSYTRENKHSFIKAYEILKNDLYDTLSEESKNNLHNFSSKYDELKAEGF